MVLTYVIKVDKREVPRPNFEIIMCFCCLLFFQENYPFAVKVNKSNFPGKTEKATKANMLKI